MAQAEKIQKVYEGRKVVAVIIDIATYEEMIEKLEQAEDIKALEELGPEPETMSFAEHRQRRHAHV